MTGAHSTSRGHHDPSPGDRSQSEVIGVTLLTGIVVVLALIVGTLVLVQMSARADEKPRADFVVHATPSEVTLTHNGGDTLDRTSLTVILSQDGTHERFAVTASALSGGDDRVEPADTITLSLPAGFASGDLRVRVVQTEESVVVENDRVTIPD